MKTDIIVPSKGNITLTDNDFLAKGGQASVYRKGNTAYKIYHDAKDMISSKKIDELKQITPTNVLKPLDIIYNTQKRPIGYIMSFATGGIPMCKLFTRSFKQSNNVSLQDIAYMVNEIQKTVSQIHGCGCLIVDLNEFNLISGVGYKTPIFLDVDSYQTPSFKATAIMESIRDPQVLNNDFTEVSDWYSFSIIAFQLYIGMHPFKGSHPNYKKKDWRKRMDDNISVFDKHASMPRSCYDLSVIPKKHLDWFKDIYVKGNRSVPPRLDGKDPIVVSARLVRTVRKHASFVVSDYIKAKDPILNVFTEFGQIAYTTKEGLFSGHRLIEKFIPNMKKQFAIVTNGTTIPVFLAGNYISIADQDILIDEAFYRDNRMYSVNTGILYEHLITELGGKIVTSKKQLTTIKTGQCLFGDGVILQQSMDKTIMINPYGCGRCSVKVIPELKDYTPLSAKAEGHIMVVICKDKGMYKRFTFCFALDFMSYNVTITDDVPNTSINFAVTQSGICVMTPDDDSVLLFKDLTANKIIDNPPFDTSTKLFSTPSGIYFVDGNEIRKVTMK